MVNKTDVNRNTRRQPHWNGKNPAQIPDAAPRSRTALDPVAYDNLIKQHGVRVKVYRSMFCPNVKSVDGGEHNIDCTLCNGSGYLDVDPIESVAYLSNQNFQEEMTVEGYHDGNSVGGTFLGGVELQYFTRVDLMDFTQPFYERVLKGPVGASTVSSFATGTFTFANMGNSGVRLENMFGDNAFFTKTEPSINPEINIINFATNANSSELAYRDDGADGTLLIIEDNRVLNNLVNLINSISTDVSNPTMINNEGTTDPSGQSIVRNCVASLNAGLLVLTMLTDGTIQEPVLEMNFGNGTFDFVQGSSASIAETTDNLKYDCGRVNVIIGIDKTETPHRPVQYFQDHHFRLSPQGNIVWNNVFQPTLELYIQYITSLLFNTELSQLCI